MNYYLCLIFLSSLSIISLVILGLYQILNRFCVSVNHKLYLLKVGVLVSAVAPILCGVLKYYSCSPIQIMLFATLEKPLPNQIGEAVSYVPNFELAFYVLLAYGIGFFAMLSQILFSYISAKKQLAASVPIILQGANIFLNKNIQSPLSFGFPKAKIYFPEDAESRWTSREIQMSLAHEKTHVSHNDSMWKLISLFARALLFFVPWSYVLHRNLELEIEIYCDQKTCAAVNATTQEYGDLLLAMISTQPRNSIVTNIANSTLKRRFIAMNLTTVKRPFLISLFSAAIILAGSAAVAMVSGIAEKKTIFDITSKIYVDGNLVSSPRIIAKANQKATIVLSKSVQTKGGIAMLDQGIKIEIIAKNTPRSGSGDAIHMSYDIQYQDGEEKMHSKPQIIVIPKQEGILNFSSESGHAYELHVIADRV